MIDLQTCDLGYYNSLTEDLHLIAKFDPSKSFQSFLVELGTGKKNLVYCNAKAKVVDFAREYADSLPSLHDPDLIALAEEIREEMADEAERIAETETDPDDDDMEDAYETEDEDPGEDDSAE